MPRPKRATPANSVDWRELGRSLQPELWSCPFGEKLDEVWTAVVMAYGDVGIQALGWADRYYLLVVILGRRDALHPWVYERCREVEREPDGYLDLWAREHYKSTIITFAGATQEVIRDPEVTIGIFSHTKPTARKFMQQIKLEWEKNDGLKATYPDIFWQEPQKDADRWSMDGGLCVKRKGNPREATIEAHGLVDGQPTSAHFRLRIYDDVVTAESVTTPEMVQKTTEMHSLSDNLGARGPDGKKRAWHVGTRYKYSDTYSSLIDRKVLKTRIYPATKDGTPDGEPVYMSVEALAESRKVQISAIFAAQMLMRPEAGLEAMFRKEQVRFTDIRPATLNVYIMCDPASSRKKGSDRTAILVVGIDSTRNKYLLDGVIHKMGLSDRWNWLKGFYQKWTQAPGVQVVDVGYERYGMMDAMEHFDERMLVEKCGFQIKELAWPREGGNAKYDRIQRLEPDFRGGRWYFIAMPPRMTSERGTLIDGEWRRVPDPDATARGLGPVIDTKAQAEMRETGQAYRILLPIHRKDHEGNIYPLNKMIFDELVPYPYSAHDDGLDCLSRIYDMDAEPPILVHPQDTEPVGYHDGI